MFGQGEQPFTISMTEAKFSVIVQLDTVTGCGQDRNLVISLIDFPLDYTAVSFQFTNIGPVLGALVDTIGTVAVTFSQGIVVESIKKVVREEVPSFLCPNQALNATKMDPIPVVADKER